jgi:hypothetical protein
MAGAPNVYYFKNNFLSRGENSRFKICSNTWGHITYGNCCIQAATVKFITGCNSATTIAMVHSKKQMVVSILHILEDGPWSVLYD